MSYSLTGHRYALPAQRGFRVGLPILLTKCPICWNPCLTKGVCLRICFFLTAGVLCHSKLQKYNVTCGKGLGKDVERATWVRINGHHVRVAEKMSARK
jgi:hypothetical protein